MDDAYQDTLDDLQKAVDDLETLPPSRANSIALTKAQEAVMWHERDMRERARLMEGADA